MSRRASKRRRTTAPIRPRRLRHAGHPSGPAAARREDATGELSSAHACLGFLEWWFVRRQPPRRSYVRACYARSVARDGCVGAHRTTRPPARRRVAFQPRSPPGSGVLSPHRETLPAPRRYRRFPSERRSRSPVRTGPPTECTAADSARGRAGTFLEALSVVSHPSVLGMLRDQRRRGNRRRNGGTGRNTILYTTPPGNP